MNIELHYGFGTATMHVTELVPNFLNYRAARGCGASRFCRSRCIHCREMIACRAEIVRRIDATTSNAELLGLGVKAYGQEGTDAVLRACARFFPKN